MKKWVTSIRATDPRDEEMKVWSGPDVPGLTMRMAEQYCQENGLGYCKVDGELIAEIPTKADGITPTFDKMVDYENTSLN